MKKESKTIAGILLIIFPVITYGGFSLLGIIINAESGLAYNPLRQELWRAGHAHAGVLLLLALVILLYVDAANLTENTKKLIRIATPVAAVLFHAAFFLSVLDPYSTEPNALITLAYPGVIILTFTFITLGIGLLKKYFKEQ